MFLCSARLLLLAAVMYMTTLLVAILLDEPERHRFNQQIAADAVRLLSAATLVETAILLTNRIGPRLKRNSICMSRKQGWRLCPCVPSMLPSRATPIASMARAGIRQD